VRIGVVITTYNERENLEALVTEMLTLQLPAATSVQLLIVDDNSPDGTGAIGDALATRYPALVRVLHRTHERGRASATLAGFRTLLADNTLTHIAEMDADFSHAPNDFPRLVAAIGSADVIIGSRYVPGGRAIDCKPINIFYSRVICFVNQALLGVGVRDSSGGYKIYARHVLESIDLSGYTARAYSVGLETLLRCRARGFSLREVPITFLDRQRGKSKVDFGVLSEYPIAVLKLKLRQMRGELG
jgi:dolichol-phosphate mannosyltransferase